MSWRPGRSVMCVSLIASATFIIVAVDAFRKTGEPSLEPESGTGGYSLLAESVVPLHHDPASEEGRTVLGLSGEAGRVTTGVAIDRFRLRPGEDASCLNLYRPAVPRILGAPAQFLDRGRFSFSSSLAGTDAERRNPWTLLRRRFDDGAVPVVGDANSLTYVMHVGVGDDMVIDAGGRDVTLRVVGALYDSVLQSELIMSEEHFLELFPHDEGYRFFLIAAPAGESEAVSGLLEARLSDFGFDVDSVARRLTSFHRVENTYLSTFQMLGGLGFLLGTLGLAAVLLRNVLERRKELALLRAVGFGRSDVAMTVIAENAWLLAWGLGAGAGCALLAILPALLDRGGAPALSFLLLLPGVAVVGLLASVVATLAALRLPLIPSLRSE